MHRRSATYYEQQRGWLKAIEHYIAAEQYEQAATLAVRDPWHLINRGQLQQLQQLLSVLVQKLFSPLLMAEVEITLALTAAYQQATVEAEGHYDQALQYLATEENSDLVRELRAKVYRHKVAYLHRYTSSDVALPLIKLGLDEVQGINSREEIELLLQRCILLRPQLQFSEAQRLFEECLAQIKPQEKRLRILALMGLSNVHFHAGEIQQGYALAVEASEIAEQVTDLANLIELRSNIANVEHQWGNWDRALALYRDVVEQATQIGYIREKYRAELNLANLLLKRGNTGEAKDLLTGIINYTRQEGLYKLLIPALGQWGKLALQQNNLPEVAHAVTEALTLATAKTLTYMLPFLYGLQASYYLALSNFSEATASANQAMQQAQGMQMRIEEGISAVLLAQIAVKQAAYETAISWLERGSALLQDDPYELAHAYLLWQQIPAEVIPDSVPHNELLIQAQALMQRLGIDYP